MEILARNLYQEIKELPESDQQIKVRDMANKLLCKLQDKRTSLLHYRVEIYKEQTLTNEDRFISETVDVIAENNQYMVLGDNHFTKLNKDKGSRVNPTIDQPSISIRTKSEILGNGVFYNLYTTKRKTPPEIKAEIRQHIKQEVGFLSGIDLSVIDKLSEA